MTEIGIRWRNFRSLEDTGWITLKPLTVVIGANNSGKTNLIAPLLMLKQTMDSPDKRTALVGTGQLIDAGTYQDFVLKHDTKKGVSFAFRFPGEERPVPKRKLPLGESPPESCEMVFSYDRPGRASQLREYTVFDRLGRAMVRRRRGNGGKYALTGVYRGRAGTAVDEGIRQSQPDHFLFSGTDALAAAIAHRIVEQFASGKLKTGRSEAEVDAEDALHMTRSQLGHVAALGAMEVQLEALLKGLRFIGPVREEPQRVYRARGDRPQFVGTRGERAPDILFRNRALSGKVATWFGRFGLGKLLECRESESESDVFSIVMRRTRGSPTATLADSGFGASQILPLIVQGFHGDDGTIIAEQPEIHLNPRLQCLLAGLICSIVNGGKRIVVETHSEHLLLSLRRLVASGKLAAEKTAVYYVEKKGDISTIRDVPIKANGHIEPGDWPAGFFEDALGESLALAAAQAGAKKNAR